MVGLVLQRGTEAKEKQAKEKKTEERQTRVSAKYLDETGGRSLRERKREEEREKERVRKGERDEGIRKREG